MTLNLFLNRVLFCCYCFLCEKSNVYRITLYLTLRDLSTLREKLMHVQRHVRAEVSTTDFRTSAGATVAMFLTLF